MNRKGSEYILWIIILLIIIIIGLALFYFGGLKIIQSVLQQKLFG
jgi:hypothetical protein